MKALTLSCALCPCRACGLANLLSTKPCNVFSLGSHGQVDFEQAVRAQYPHCRIFVYDHTLTEEQRAAVLAVNGMSAFLQTCRGELRRSTSRCATSMNCSAPGKCWSDPKPPAV